MSGNLLVFSPTALYETLKKVSTNEYIYRLLAIEVFGRKIVEEYVNIQKYDYYKYDYLTWEVNCESELKVMNKSLAEELVKDYVNRVYIHDEGIYVFNMPKICVDSIDYDGLLRNSGQLGESFKGIFSEGVINKLYDYLFMNSREDFSIILNQALYDLAMFMDTIDRTILSASDPNLDCAGVLLDSDNNCLNVYVV